MSANNLLKRRFSHTISDIINLSNPFSFPVRILFDYSWKAGGVYRVGIVYGDTAASALRKGIRKSLAGQKNTQQRIQRRSCNQHYQELFGNSSVCACRFHNMGILQRTHSFRHLQIYSLDRILYHSGKLHTNSSYRIQMAWQKS